MVIYLLGFRFVISKPQAGADARLGGVVQDPGKGGSIKRSSADQRWFVKGLLGLCGGDLAGRWVFPKIGTLRLRHPGSQAVSHLLGGGGSDQIRGASQRGGV